MECLRGGVKGKREMRKKERIRGFYSYIKTSRQGIEDTKNKEKCDLLQHLSLRVTDEA